MLRYAFSAAYRSHQGSEKATAGPYYTYEKRLPMTLNGKIKT